MEIARLNQSSGSNAQHLLREQLVALVPRLRRLCIALAQSRDAGDDLAQATLERALERIGQWRGETDLDRWIFAIARNLFIDQARAAQRRGVAVDVDEAFHLVGEDGRAVTEERSDLQWAQRAILALPDDQRTLVALVIIDGQSYSHAAELLGIPIGTVMSRLGRARKSIEKHMRTRTTELSS